MALTKIVAKTGIALGITAYVAFALLPVFWMVSLSLKYPQDIMTASITWLPSHIDWSNYANMWSTVPLLRYLKNSMIISLSTVLVCMVVSIPAAYAFTRFRFRGRRVFGMSALATQLFPGILLLLPIFVMYTQIQRLLHISLIGTYPGIIVTYTIFGLPFSIWMLRSYFETIPEELDEAALIDGCSRRGALVRIILPLAAPGLAATAMYVFVLAWNEVLFASVLTNQTTRPFSIGLHEFANEYSLEYGQLMAACFTVSIPIIALFMLFQRWIVSGLVGGAVKG